MLISQLHWITEILTASPAISELASISFNSTILFTLLKYYIIIILIKFCGLIHDLLWLLQILCVCLGLVVAHIPHGIFKRVQLSSKMLIVTILG